MAGILSARASSFRSRSGACGRCTSLGGALSPGWWIAAALAVASGADIEAAKAASVVLAFALFFAVFGTAVLFRFGSMRAVALSALVVCNPVVLVQLFSRMNDGQMGASFGLMIMFIIAWLLDRRVEYLVAAASVAAYALNLKFSSVPLFVMLSTLLAGSVAFIIGRSSAWRIFLFLCFTGAASVLLVGAHPYLTNLIYHHHPFYPLMGPSAVDIMTEIRPSGFSEIGHVQRLLRSYFSTTSTGYDGPAHLKIPFSIYKSELYNAGSYDARFGGFGPLFSGAILVAAAVGAWIAITPSRRSDRVALIAAALLAIGSFSFPEAWLVRYVSQLWWVPVIVAAVALSNRRRYLRVAGWALTAILLVNVSVVSISWARYQGGQQARQARSQLATIALDRKPICAFLGESHSRLELLRNWGAGASPK